MLIENVGKKIIFALVATALGFLIFHSYPIIRDRYFPNEDEAGEENTQADSEKDSTEESENASDENIANSQKENREEEKQKEAVDPELEKIIKEEDAEEENAANEAEEEDSYVRITSQDCQNRCQDFSDDDELEYCQEYCGLRETKNNSDCSDMEGLDIDYCYKTLAIANKDYSICDKIKDTGIQKTCRNRITEDILDSQPQPEPSD